MSFLAILVDFCAILGSFSAIFIYFGGISLPLLCALNLPFLSILPQFPPEKANFFLLPPHTAHFPGRILRNFTGFSFIFTRRPPPAGSDPPPPNSGVPPLAPCSHLGPGEEGVRRAGDGQVVVAATGELGGGRGDLGGSWGVRGSTHGWVPPP